MRGDEHQWVVVPMRGDVHKRVVVPLSGNHRLNDGGFLKLRDRLAKGRPIQG